MRFDHVTQFRFVNSNGNSNQNGAGNAYSVCVGFYPMVWPGTQFRYVNSGGSARDDNNRNASNAWYVCVGSYFSQSEYLLRESSAEWIEGWPDLPKGKYSSRHGRADAACMVMVFGDP